MERERPESTAVSAEVGRRAPRAGVLLAAVLALTALSYASALDGEFVWDDHALIGEEPLVRQLQPLSSYFGRSFWSNPEQSSPRSFYRPLTTVTYALDHAVWRGSPFGFRVTNLLLHLGCVALVFALALRARANPLAAALGAALFGVMPRLTESVAWISGRTDLLAGLAALTVLLLYRSEPGAAGRRWLAAGVLLCGLLCKEVALAALPAIVVLELMLARRDGWNARRIAGNVAPFGATLAAYALLRLQVELPHKPEAYFGTLERVVFACEALGSYLLMLLDPLRPRLQIGVLGYIDVGRSLLGGVVLIGLALLPVRALRGAWAPLPCAALALGLAAIVPVLHVVPIEVNIVAADRFLYLPVAGLAIALAAWSRLLDARWDRGVAVCAAAALPVFAVATHVRALDWREELGLYELAIERSHPDNALPQTLLGMALLRRDRPQEALHHLERSRERLVEQWGRYVWVPKDGFVLANIAVAHGELGQLDAAIDAMLEAVRVGPYVPVSRYNLAVMFARSTRFAEAERELRYALALYPGYERAQRLLVELRWVRAEWTSLPAEREDETGEIAARRARVFARMGRLEAASRCWERVLADPDAAPGDLEGAALFLTARGAVEKAERAVARLRAVLPGSADLPRLELALEARRSDPAL